ncbi:hypothetical protein ACIPH4_18455 [Streptomyces tendae]
MPGMVTEVRPQGRDELNARVRIGALAPLTRPGRQEAGRHLLAGTEPAGRPVRPQ